MGQLFVLVTLLGFASITQANDSFVVNSKIYENNELIGSPTLTVNANGEAAISVEDLYSFALTVSPVDDSTVNLATRLEIGGEEISPSLVVEIGKNASISVGSKELSVIVNKPNS